MSDEAIKDDGFEREVMADGSTSLRIRTLPGLLPVATSFAESSAVAAGLARRLALSLSLATEEMFMHFCRTRPDAPEIELSARDAGHCVALEFKFDGYGFDMSAFNITAKGSAELDGEEAERTALMLAARSVDSFSLVFGEGGTLCLALVKEKPYAEAVKESIERPDAKSWQIAKAAPEEVELLCRMTASLEEGRRPDFIARPGKSAAMLGAGSLAALLAKAPDGSLCGGMVWRELNSRAVECFGPYVLTDGDAVRMRLARELMDAFMSGICKGSHSIALARDIAPDFAKGFFEPLDEKSSAFFRQLREDGGATLWIPGALSEYVKAECGRLFLPRRILEWRAPESAAPGAVSSVIFTSLDKDAGRAAMRPVRGGCDIKANIEGHVSSLLHEGFRELVFELDLGVPWQGAFGSELPGCGFRPELLLPSAGEGDMLTMRHHG